MTLHGSMAHDLSWTLGADWTTCGTQTHLVPRPAGALEFASHVEPGTRETADLLVMSVVSTLHDVSSDLDSHALTLAQTVCLAP